MHSLYKNIFLHQRNSFRNLICFQTLGPFSTTVTQYQPPHNSIIVDLLINSFGFTEDEAISVSKRLRFTVPPSNINRVPDLLKQNGFSDTHIKNLISIRPRVLSLKNQTLKPKLNLLQELGFCGSDLADLIIKNPNILAYGIDNYLIPNVKFLQALSDSNENIVKALKKSSWFLSFNFRKTIGCNVEILRQCSIPDKQISTLLFKQPRFFTQRPDWVKNHISRVEKFGFKRGSGSFIYAVYALSTMTKATLQVKFNMYKSYGWSESDIVSAFRKVPNLLMYSEQKVKAAMDFFVGEIGYNPKDFSSNPHLFTYSLEKRLKPRYEVLKILKSRGLKLECNILSVAVLPEKLFLKRYVLRYVEKAPDLQQVYMDSILDLETTRKKDG
ncbi:Mitochodrial transcription termination factor-related [Macleaya cordata]|uniref:Mitochodrial transcription termination factor-related n=1 Tax=Macleaya cordata TaxID=56857 RepID=A0A200Q808_MACCD|nr:Mitochodrial transcription termination factor-related [Macleaya cordata]